jgi:hypothetical protein
MKRTHYIIKDWIDNQMFSNKKFNSFDEAWEFIYENVDNSEFDKTGNENDNVYQDIFVHKIEQVV